MTAMNSKAGAAVIAVLFPAGCTHPSETSASTGRVHVAAAAILASNSIARREPVRHRRKRVVRLDHYGRRVGHLLRANRVRMATRLLCNVYEGHRTR
jgi:hypothetical protein